MKENSAMTVLCMSSYEKGQEFMRQCKREGCRVILLTSKSLENADWPSESGDGWYVSGFYYTGVEDYIPFNY